MGVPEQTSRQEDHEDSLLLQPSWRWHLVPLRKRPSLDPTQRLRLILGMDTTATGHTDMATTAMATDMATTTERGLLMLSQLLRLLPTQRLRLIPGMDTTDTATGHTDMATTATDLTDMATITERGLLMPSQLLKLLPTQRLRLIPGMDTTATATGHTDMATTATGLMVMLTGVKRYS